MAAPAERIPVTILTGFLGAGKSTLLNRLLKHPAMTETAVVINEFGEVGIDHLLVQSSGDAFVELANGCICCSVRGELTDTLQGFIDEIAEGRMRPIRRVVIETTGLADPVPVIQSIIGHPDIAIRFALDGVVTVVDAIHGRSTLEHYEEARRQVALADRLVLSKRPMADSATIDALTHRLRDLNPAAPLVEAEAVVSPAALFAGLFDPETKTADIRRWLNDDTGPDHVCDDHCHHHSGHDHHHAHGGHAHDHDIRSFSIIHDRPVDPMALNMFVDLLRSAHGDRLLRMKAVVALSDDPERPLVLQGVQSIFHAPERLPAWPDPSDRRSRLVLITRDLPEDFVRGLFDAFTGTPRIDRPDRQAIEENPLAIPGLRL